MWRILTLILASLWSCQATAVFAQGDPRDKPNPDNPAAFITGRYKQTQPSVAESLPFEVRTDGRKQVLFLGLHADWKGTFEPGGPDKPDRIVATRKPGADQINVAEIPEVARKKVAGSLQWKLELEVHECAADGFTLEATWYPGEVSWTGTGEDARVTGPGKPIKFTMVREEPQPKAWETTPGRALLRVVPVDIPLAATSLGAVTLGKPFTVTARLSPQLARASGDTLNATIKGMQSGKTAVVQLKRYGGPNAQPVIYMTSEPVVLGEPFSNLDSYYDLKLSQGETVTVTAANSTTSFLYFKSWVQLGMAMHQQQFDALRKFYLQIQSDPKQTYETKNDATVRLELINNANMVMAHKAGDTEKFTDYTRYYIGEAYLQLLQRPASSWGQKFRQPPLDGFGVPYFFEEEVKARSEAIRNGNKAWDEALFSLSKELTLGLYDFVTASTGADQFVALVWGIDTRGNPVDVTDRIFAGIGLGSQLLLVGASTMKGLEAMQASKLETEHQIAIGKWHDARMAEEPPVSLRPGPSPALRAGKAPNFVEIVGGNLRELDPEKAPFRSLGPTDTSFETPTSVGPMNSRGTPLQFSGNACGVMTAEGMLVDAGFPAIEEKRAITEGFNRGNWSAGLTDMGGGNLEGGGMNAKGMQGYLEYHGAETKRMNYPKFRELTAELNKGNKVAVLFNAGTEQAAGYHWIRLEGLECGTNSRTYVRIGDPWTGRSWRVRSDVLMKRTVAAVSADFSKVTQFVR